MDDIFLKVVLGYECCHVYREVNRTIICLAKRVLWSIFFKDIVNISYKYYYGYRFNLYVISMFYGLPSPKKEKRKKMMNLKKQIIN